MQLAVKERIWDGSAPEKPWDRQRDEPTLWFKRFSALLADGANPNGHGGISGRICQAPPRQNLREGSATHWRVISARWNWRSRAEAWDKEQLTLASMAIRNRLVALQAQRLDMTAELINQARTVLHNAHLEEADETQARAWLARCACSCAIWRPFSSANLYCCRTMRRTT